MKRLILTICFIVGLLEPTGVMARPALLVSPSEPKPNVETTLVAASAAQVDVDGEWRCSGPGGSNTTLRQWTSGGPPHWRVARFKPTSAGRYSCTLGKNPPVSVDVVEKPKLPRKKQPKVLWENRSGWTSDWELLYSTWVEFMFMVPEGTSWNGLHSVTRDPERNLLHNHLGLAEDDPASRLRMEPDCVENPYFMRAYFAWKVGLPFGHHTCKTRLGGRGPSCRDWTDNSTQVPASSDPVRSFSAYLGNVGRVVHSGAARTPIKEEATDLYPVELTRQALVPGTVYADPYGHTLTLVHWIPQTPTQPGSLLAVDAQPDGTVQIKRFWQGNFVFTTDVPGGPGFKHFRPVVAVEKKRGSKLRYKYMSNAELKVSSEFAKYSDLQARLNSTTFFDTMDAVINPSPLDPFVAYKALHEAIIEQLVVRVQSVENGEVWKRQKNFPAIPMPDGPSIFQTGGPWEDFSTPSRDLRLLIALDILLDFPDKVVRTPGLYRLPAGKSAQQVRKELIDAGVAWRKDMGFEYIRSDGTRHRLTLADVLSRREAFEMAYNPNDCAEVRWGARPDTAEFKPCRHRRPAVQEKKMKKCRQWFRERRRPAW